MCGDAFTDAAQPVDRRSRRHRYRSRVRYGTGDCRSAGVRGGIGRGGRSRRRWLAGAPTNLCPTVRHCTLWWLTWPLQTLQRPLCRLPIRRSVRSTSFVNAAGVSFPVALTDEGFADAWRLTFAVNVDAQAHLIAACLADLQAQRRRARRKHRVDRGAWSDCSDGTVYREQTRGGWPDQVTRGGNSGHRAWTVNCICPGPINTGMTADIKDEHKAIYARRRTAPAALRRARRRSRT